MYSGGHFLFTWNNAIILWVASLGETSAMLRLASCLLCLRPPGLSLSAGDKSDWSPGACPFSWTWSRDHCVVSKGCQGYWGEFYEVESAVFWLIWVDPLPYYPWSMFSLISLKRWDINWHTSRLSDWLSDTLLLFYNYKSTDHLIADWLLFYSGFHFYVRSSLSSF